MAGLRVIFILSFIWGMSQCARRKACEFHFENGNIRDWIKTGSAFDNQPTFGDNPTARNRGQPANQQGDWWIGTFEDHPCPKGKAGYIQGDGPTGTLTSPEFKIVGEQISFLIGGGCGDNPSNYAQLIVEGKEIEGLKTTGDCHETMQRKSWNVARFKGRKARVQLVDNGSGGWEHINFDDLKGDIVCYK